MSKNSVLNESVTIFDYYTETFQLPDGSYVNCEILDTGGSENFNSLNRIYYKRADCCVLVYDITNLYSFEECQNYYKNEIKNNCKNDIKVILVGNKTDLEKNRKISKEKGAELAEQCGYYFRETSCEKNFNVANAFETIIIMTHNDMVKNGKQNLGNKKNIDTFKLEEGAVKLENENKIIDNNNGENVVEVKVKKKKKQCC